MATVPAGPLSHIDPVPPSGPAAPVSTHQSQAQQGGGHERRPTYVHPVPLCTMMTDCVQEELDIVFYHVCEHGSDLTGDVALARNLSACYPKSNKITNFWKKKRMLHHLVTQVTAKKDDATNTCSLPFVGQVSTRILHKCT